MGKLVEKAWLFLMAGSLACSGGSSFLGQATSNEDEAVATNSSDQESTSVPVETAEARATATTAEHPWKASLPSAVAGTNLLSCHQHLDDTDVFSYVCQFADRNDAIDDWSTAILRGGVLTDISKQTCPIDTCDFRIVLPEAPIPSETFVVIAANDGTQYVVEPTPLPAKRDQLHVQRSFDGVLTRTSNNGRATMFRAELFQTNEPVQIEIACIYGGEGWLAVRSGPTSGELSLFAAHLPLEGERSTLLRWQVIDSAWWSVSCPGNLDIAVIKP